MQKQAFLSLISSNTVQEVNSLVNRTFSVKDLRELLRTNEELDSIRMEMSKSYAKIDAFHKQEWQALLPNLVRALKDLDEDSFTTSIRQGKYTRTMHDGITDLIDRELIVIQSKIRDVQNKNADILKVNGNTFNVNQITMVTSKYIGKKVFEVATTIAHDPNQRGSPGTTSAKERHIQAARAVVFPLLGNESKKTDIKVGLDVVILAALASEYNIPELGDHIKTVNKTVEDLQRYIYNLAKVNQDWGLAPVMAPKKVSRSAPTESFFNRTIRAQAKTNINQNYHDDIKTEPSNVRTGLLGTMMSAAASSSDPSGAYTHSDI